MDLQILHGSQCIGWEGVKGVIDEDCSSQFQNPRAECFGAMKISQWKYIDNPWT